MYANRLEKLLQVIEDITWLIQTEAKYSQEWYPNFPEDTQLRHALVTRNEELAVNVLRRYLVQREDDPDNRWRGNILRVLSLVDWVFESRRAYRVSPALAQMLLETELPTFTPETVRWVAPAFLVLLEEPVVSESGFAHDCMLISQATRLKQLRSEFADSDVSPLSIQSYGGGFDSYERISAREKELYVRSCRRRHPRLRRMHEQFTSRAVSCDTRGFVMNAFNDKPYNRIMESQDWDASDWSVMFRLCMGLNLYLQSARTGDAEVRQAIAVRGSERGPSISDGAALFDLAVGNAFHGSRGSCAELSDGYRLRPHFRKGFWRRPRGFGSDPDAPQTEWVRPTWVHKDRIAQGEQPIGSMHTAKAVEQ